MEGWLLKFPGDIRQFYRSRIKNIEESNSSQKQLALAILSWLHYSHGIAALTVRQLTEALYFGYHEPPLLTKEKIQQACQGLVRVRYNYVQFVDSVFNSYLREEAPDGLPSAQQLAKYCLNSLDFRPPTSASEETLTPSRGEDFQAHAAQFWASYAEQAIDNGASEFRKFILERLMSARKRQELIETLRRAKPETEEIRQTGWTPLNVASGQTPLHILINGGLDRFVLEILSAPREFLKLLGIPPKNHVHALQELGSIQSEDSEGQTLLHCAAMRSLPQAAVVVSELIKQGAKVAAKTNRGFTAIHCCAYSGNKTVMRLLLDAHASVSDVDQTGRTPAHIAAHKGNLEALKLLVENGANLSAEDFHGYNVLHYAINLGQVPVIEYILDQIPELLNAGPVSPLHRAVDQCQVEVIDILMKYKADVMSKAKIMLYALPHVTPLEVSIKSGQPGPAEELISYGACLRIYKNFLVTQNRWAVLNGDSKLATKLAVDKKPVSRTVKEWDTLDMDGEPLTIPQLEQLREISPYHPVPKLLLAKRLAEEGAQRFYTAQRLFESVLALDQSTMDSDEGRPALGIPPIVHRTIQCNLCGMHPLRGLRYKCSLCAHFDICHNCWKEKGHRLDHPLITLPSIDWLKEHHFPIPENSRDAADL